MVKEKFLINNNLLKNLYLYCLFFLLWMVPRFSAIVENVLLFDDHSIINGMPFSITLEINRPTQYLILQFWSSIFPDYFSTRIPKILAGIYLSGFSFLTFKILRNWGLSGLISFFMVALFVSHPLINEVTLWGATQNYPLMMLFMAVAFLLVQAEITPLRLIFASLFVAAGTLGYQPYLGAYIAFIITAFFIESISQTSSPSRSFMLRSLAILFSLIIYVIYDEIVSDLILGVVESHLPTVFSSSLPQDYLYLKVKACINLFVDTIVPIFSFYSNVDYAFRKWEVIPISLFILMVFLGLRFRIGLLKTLIMALVMSMLPLLVLSSIFLSSSSPQAWRISVLSLLSLILEVAVFAHIINLKGSNVFPHRKGTVLGVLLFASVLLFILPVTVYDVQRRVKVYQEDRDLTAAIQNYWRTDHENHSGSDFRVAVFNLDNKLLKVDNKKIQEVTTAYQVILSYSVFASHELASLSYFNKRDMNMLFFPANAESIKRFFDICDFKFASENDGQRTKRPIGMTPFKNPICSYIYDKKFDKINVIDDEEFISNVEASCSKIITNADLKQPRRVLHYPERRISVICSYPNRI